MAVPRSTYEAFDLRGWPEKAEKIGQLRRVENAEARLEIGAISELNSKRRGPALLFTKVPGYRPDFGVLTSSMLNARTLGLTLGIDEELDNIGIVNRIASMLRECESHASEYPMVPFYSIGETEVIQVSRLALERAVERDDTLCRWLLKYMCQRYSELLDELEVSTLLPLRQRIETFERKLTQRIPVSVERPVPQTILAWAVGGHPVSVCRALKGA